MRMSADLGKKKAPPVGIRQAGLREWTNVNLIRSGPAIFGLFQLCRQDAALPEDGESRWVLFPQQVLLLPL